jgi:hypothetical protein
MDYLKKHDKQSYSFENMNIYSAKILFNYIKYSKDFLYDFNFLKYEKNIKFIDAGFCEFNHVINDYDFKRFTKSNLHLNEFVQENKILSNDVIIENNLSNFFHNFNF